MDLFSNWNDVLHALTEKDRGDNEPEQPLAVNGHVTNGGDSVSVNGGVNGDSDGGLDGSSTSAIETVQPTTSRRDLVLITGRKDNCEAAKEAILVQNLTVYLA